MWEREESVLGVCNVMCLWVKEGVWRPGVVVLRREGGEGRHLCRLFGLVFIGREGEREGGGEEEKSGGQVVWCGGREGERRCGCVLCEVCASVWHLDT